MPIGMLGDQRPQLPQIIACQRAALDLDRFQQVDFLQADPFRVQQKMSKLQVPAVTRRDPHRPVLARLTHTVLRSHGFAAKIE